MVIEVNGKVPFLSMQAINKDFIAATEVKKINSVMPVVPNYRKRVKPWEIKVAQSCTAGLRLSGGWSKFVSDMNINEWEKWLLSASTVLCTFQLRMLVVNMLMWERGPLCNRWLTPPPEDGERNGKRHRVEGESSNTKEVVEISS